MENWLTEKEFLDQIAVHYETGEKIPQELVRKLVDASNFNTGYFCCRQLSFGLLDMAWHTQTVPFEGDVITFEKQAWAQTVIVPEVPGTLMSSSFGHIFSGGYAAGYYGYKWAEVLDADAFSVFKEAGIFNRETARSFRENILSKGGRKTRPYCINASADRSRRSMPCLSETGSNRLNRKQIAIDIKIAKHTIVKSIIFTFAS